LQESLVELRARFDKLDTERKLKEKEKRKLSEKFEEMNKMNPVGDTKGKRVFIFVNILKLF
jgi:hypothetical protein